MDNTRNPNDPNDPRNPGDKNYTDPQKNQSYKSHDTPQSNPNDPNRADQQREESAQTRTNEEYREGSHINHLQANDIRQILKNGHAKIGEEEFEIENAHDPELRKLAHQEEMSVKALGGAENDGECKYELTSPNGKHTVRVTVCNKNR